MRQQCRRHGDDTPSVSPSLSRITAVEEDAGDEMSFRLPRNFVPRRYDLLFAPRPAEGVFAGVAVVAVEVAVPLPSPSRSLTLHALELAIDPSHVCAAVGGGERLVECVGVRGAAASETITLEFASFLPNEAGATFALRFSHFTGVIHPGSNSRGLFYSNPNNTNFLSTYLEPTNARLLFPCFDEPSFRAVFQLTVEFDSRYTVIAGTKPVREELLPVDVDAFTARFANPLLSSPEYEDNLSSSRNRSVSVLSSVGRSRSNRSNRSRSENADGDNNVDVDVDEVEAEDDSDSSNEIESCTTQSRGAVPGCIVATEYVATFLSPQEQRNRCNQGTPKQQHQHPHHQQQLRHNSNNSNNNSNTNRQCHYQQQQRQQLRDSRSSPWQQKVKGHTRKDASPHSRSYYIRRVTFDETPILCTTIFGFNTGKFCIIEKETTRHKLLCRVVFPADVHVNNGWYALDLLTKAVKFFDGYFNFPLPLQKLDLVGLRCFGALGMENWGMINLHLDYMLVNESTPLERRQRIARLIGHEVSHQWLGDWATISWWNFMWMKEGFCRYLEFLFVDAVFPNWLMWDEFLTQVLDDALLLDTQSEKTHPVQGCSNNPRKIKDYFDSISYGKGAAIVRLISSLLGKESLQAATRRLLQDCRNSCYDSNVFHECLLQGEKDAERCEVATAIMHHAEQSGHPLLYIKQKVNGVCSVTQYIVPDLRQGILQKYAKLQQVSDKVSVLDFMAPCRRRLFKWNPEQFLKRSDYTVPVSIVELQHGSSSFSRAFLMRSQQETINGLPGQLIFFNYRGTGVMRCDYDTATWLRIFEFSPFLSSEDRIVITMTLFQFRNIHIGQDDTNRMDRCLLLLEWLLFITQSNVVTASQWSYITKHIESIVYMVRDYHCWNLFSKFVCSLYMPLLRRGFVSFAAQEQTVSFEAQSDVSRMTVLHILQVLAICQSPWILDESRQVAERAIASIIPDFAKNNNSNNNNNSSSGAYSPPYHGIEFNINNDPDAAAASIAFQCLTEHGDIKMWWTLACILGSILSFSMRVIAEELHFKKVEGIQASCLDEVQETRWVNMIAPAIFAFDTSSTLPFLMCVLEFFEIINTPIAKAILRNKRLVTAIFECTPRTQSMRRITVIRQLLIMHGAMYCSDGSLIQLMQAFLTKEEDEKKKGSSEEKNNTPHTAAAAGGGISRSSSVANVISTMKTNRHWMEYCCDYYETFLLKRFPVNEWKTPTSATHSPVTDIEGMGRGEVSI